LHLNSKGKTHYYYGRKGSLQMSYTIVADVCEGIGDCIPVCPVECIHWADGKTNEKGTAYTYIDDETCIDCGACLSACPIEGAILDEWKPELQKP
jgi:NAD-dependent dihydropyrimidine dehydrogenase PreA subunit